MKRPDLLPTTFQGSLYRLTEELGELIQAIGKLQRYGVKAIDPKTWKHYDNGNAMLIEMNDVRDAITRTERLLPLDTEPQTVAVQDAILINGVAFNFGDVVDTKGTILCRPNPGSQLLAFCEEGSVMVREEQARAAALYGWQHVKTFGDIVEIAR